LKALIPELERLELKADLLPSCSVRVKMSILYSLPHHSVHKNKFYTMSLDFVGPRN